MSLFFVCLSYLSDYVSWLFATSLVHAGREQGSDPRGSGRKTRVETGSDHSIGRRKHACGVFVPLPPPLPGFATGAQCNRADRTVRQEAKPGDRGHDLEKVLLLGVLRV